jgi:hypothetical protein
MATPPAHEHPDASPQDPKKPLNWGWIWLGGCLGLAAFLLLNPISLSLLGMVIWSWQEERESDRRQAQATVEAIATAEASGTLCQDVQPEVVARIEAALTVPGTTLRGVRAVRSDTDPQRWVVAADLEGVDRYAGDDDIGVWTVRWDGATQPATTEAPASIAAVNWLAWQAGPFRRSTAEWRLVTVAVACANEALGRG